MTTHGGYVQKMTKNGDLLPVVKFGKPCEGIWQEHICGRPLGIHIDSNGIMHVADAYYGIKKVNLSSGEVEDLVDVTEKIDGVAPMIPNAVDVSKTGDVYWTDSSISHKLNDGLFTLLGNGNGRLLMYNAKTKRSEVLLNGLHFSNGVLLSDDESYVIAAETFKSRLIKYYIKGPQKGTSDVFIDDLPGFPDNLKRDANGNCVVSLILPTNLFYEYIVEIPLLRKFIARTLALKQMLVKTVSNIYQHVLLDKLAHWIGHFEMLRITSAPRMTVIVLNKNGDIIESLHATDGKVAYLSSLVQFNGFYYLGSPYNSYLGRVKIQKDKVKV
ncbi:adipocyte plasma membrane-associated protein-like isoform X2 [Cimex lectularius]|nr:adipocyte plasma membrane-associated protein-like isoform X2 [Cimex lectularius]